MLINYESKSSLETMSAADLRASLAAYYGTRADDMEDSSEVFVSVHAFFHLQQDILEFIHRLCGSCSGTPGMQPSQCISHKVRAILCVFYLGICV